MSSSCPLQFWCSIDPVFRHPPSADRATRGPVLRHSRGGGRLARVGAAPSRGAPSRTGPSAPAGFLSLGGGRRRHRRAPGALAFLPPRGAPARRRSAASESLGRPVLDGRRPRRDPRGGDLLPRPAHSILALLGRVRARRRARVGGGAPGMLLGARPSRAPHLFCARRGIPRRSAPRSLLLLRLGSLS